MYFVKNGFNVGENMRGIILTNKIFKLTKIIREEHPFLRCMQIMQIAAFLAGWENSDLFYCPDSVILKGLNMMVNDKSWSQGWDKNS